MEDCNMATRKQISSDYSCCGWGNDKGKHCKSNSSPGCVILTEETAAEQQPHRALPGSATKAAGISATFAVNYTKSLFKWLISCKYLCCFFRWKASAQMVLCLGTYFNDIALC
jgi:hypothetical protein